jgi:hypothetical protein
MTVAQREEKAGAESSTAVVVTRVKKRRSRRFISCSGV